MYTAYHEMLILLQQQIQAKIRQNAPKSIGKDERYIALEEKNEGSGKIKTDSLHSACVQL